MRKYLLFILVLFSFLFTNVYAEEYKYLVDDGGILKEDTEQYINTYSEYLYDVSNIEYYVITVDNLGEYDLDSYADIVYSNYINSNKDKGLLLFVCKKTRQVKVIAGRGISRVVTNEVINKYMDDYIVSYLSEDNWDKGIKNGYTAFYKYLCYHLDIDTSGLEVVNGNSFLFKYRYIIFFICIWICNIIGYILPKYFMRLFNNKYKVSITEHLIFLGAVFINVVILYYNYIFMKNFLYAIFAFEIFAILSGTILNNDNVKRKKIDTSKKYKKVSSRSVKIKKKRK